MAHVPTPSGAPGIGGLFDFRPATGAPLMALAEQLLRGPSSLSSAERELIATFVSSSNQCRFCTRSHRAVTERLGTETAVVEAVLTDGPAAAPTPKLRALLAIAKSVAGPVGPVPDALVAEARAAGADDIAIHDTVLVAAAFSMFNRYVDGLGAFTPDEGPGYAAGAERLVTNGYVRPINPG
jgi:uncharacterized peroxidase-related enzyme